MVPIALVGACTPQEQTTPPAAAATRLDIQGHRGARGLRPENTVQGFELAAELGVTTLELDLHLTADDRLLVWHDPVVGPDKCDVQTPLVVRETTMEVLRAVVCNRNPDAERFPQQRAGAPEGLHLIELGDVLGNPTLAKLRLNIELKRTLDGKAINDGFDGTHPATFERVVVQQINAYAAADRVTVQSFDHRCLWALHSLAPELPLAALTEGAADLVQLAGHGATIWSPHYEVVDAAAVELAHQAGLEVIPWTVNEATDISRMIDLGVDGIISDRPDRVLQAQSR